MDRGNFQVNFEGKTSQQTTKLNTQGLLMEGLRLLDEANREGGEPEPADVQVTEEPTPTTRPTQPAQPTPVTQPARATEVDDDDFLLDS